MNTVAVPPKSWIMLSAAVLLVGLWASFPSQAFSGTTGKIAGRVVDAATGEPLPGVNVVIDGTTKGAATDLDGYYVILQVKPGEYALRASIIGFAVQIVQGVKVQVDKTTTVDFNLEEEIFEGQEVVVTAERGIVEVDRTTTTAVVDGEQLAALPVTGIGDAINLQAGVVDGRFRGGRSGEVAYLVNGVPINNAFNNQAAFDVEQNMVASLEVISGVFNAEYGQALSGVVNIVTKDLPSEWSGSFLGYVGTLVSSEKVEFVKRTGPAGSGLIPSDFQSERVSFTEASDLDNLLDVQASIGGPILKNKLSIQATGRFIRDKGHLLGRDLFSPTDSSSNLTNDPSTWQIESTGDGDFVPLGWSERYSLNTTLGYRLSGAVRLEYNGFFQDGEGRGYSHQLKYVPEGINKFLFSSQTHIVSLRYTVGAKSFGSVSYSLLRDKFDSQLYDLPGSYDESRCVGLAPSERLREENLQACRLDSRYASPLLSGLQGTNAFSVGGNDLFSNDELTKTHTILADFSSQVTRVHLMKVGVQARLHSLDNRSFGIEKSARTGNTAQVSPNVFSDNILKASPTEFSAYAQDKMEFEGLIVNAGLRLDYFDPDYDIPNDWSQAAAERIINPCLSLDESQRSTCFDRFADVDGIMTADSVSNRTSADVELQLSPRLGIAFPISSTGVMRFSAGMFFQTPQLNLLYTNP
ncbi:MAG: TonB-dependent receptor, partial [Rhodothermia bacterium]|nr:TonB-dependent receptor [Rhodothermia bacterium]